jgi:hypothetical protein
MADKYEIAKELTLAIIDKIKPVNLADNQSINQSYVEEINKAYTSFYNNLKQIEKENYIGPVNIRNV